MYKERDVEILKKPQKFCLAQQLREMGVVVGDVIEGHESYACGGWNHARLRILWMGDTEAVVFAQTKTDRNQEWMDVGEESSWTLHCRDWWKVPNEQN